MYGEGFSSSVSTSSFVNIQPGGCARRATLTAILEAYLCRHSARATSASSDSLGDVVNARDSEGRTPLYIACQFGHVECARFLVGNGAKRTLADYKGSTPLHVCVCRTNSIDALDALRKAQRAAAPPLYLQFSTACRLPLPRVTWGSSSCCSLSSWRSWHTSVSQRGPRSSSQGVHLQAVMGQPHMSPSKWSCHVLRQQAAPVL
jgi:hypothetical protein